MGTETLKPLYTKIKNNITVVYDITGNLLIEKSIFTRTHPGNAITEQHSMSNMLRDSLQTSEPNPHKTTVLFHHIQ